MTCRACPLVFALLAACASEAPPRPADDFRAFADLRVTDYPGADTILSGLAAVDDAGLRVGDAALFAVELVRDATTRRELLLLEITGLGTGASGGRRVRTAAITWTPDDGEPELHRLRLHEVDLSLRRYRPDGHAIGNSRIVLYEEALRTGWWPDTEAKASRRDMDLSFVMTMSLQGLLDSDPTLQELLFVLVDRPSLLSIATHFGVEVNVQTSPQADAPRRPPAFADLAPDAIAVTNKDLRLNGSQALWADLFVTRPVGALGACGGLLGAVARNATDPARSATLRLLATRRGDAR